jgi:hypothetical protein
MAMQTENVELFEKIKHLTEEDVVNMSAQTVWNDFLSKYEEINNNKLKLRLKKEREKSTHIMQKEKDRVNKILQESLVSFY